MQIQYAWIFDLGGLAAMLSMQEHRLVPTDCQGAVIITPEATEPSDDEEEAACAAGSSSRLPHFPDVCWTTPISSFWSETFAVVSNFVWEEPEHRAADRILRVLHATTTWGSLPRTNQYYTIY